MLRSIGCAAGLIVFFSIGCEGSTAAPSPSPLIDWTPLAPDEAARARALIRGTELPTVDALDIGGVPLESVTTLAASPGGLIVGGVSPADDLFWDAWLVPRGGPARQLAPIGDNLIGADAAGVLWTTIVSEDEAGNPTREVRLSPADGGPSRPLSPNLPADFAAERAVPDGSGGQLLIGTEVFDDGVSHASIHAVAADGTARRIAADPRPDPAVVVAAVPAAEVVYVEILYAPEGRVTIAKIPLRDLTNGAGRGP
jgi:hypothetical protein